MSLLRTSCFTIVNDQPDDNNTSQQLYRNPDELVTYTKSFCRKIEARKHEDSNDLADDVLRTHAYESSIDDSLQEHETNKFPRKESNETTTTEKDGSVLPMDKCIKLLEPHLAGFRKKYEANARMETSYAEDDDDITDFIPQQLIRMTRFFPFKWIPLKRALLRSPSYEEVRIGALRIFFSLVFCSLFLHNFFQIE